ncbi:MAG: 23S rRNA (guanosine(2251)-2'-O)-methyltransferase RlmB, partial [Acidimicrobiales bacterium]
GRGPGRRGRVVSRPGRASGPGARRGAPRAGAPRPAVAEQGRRPPPGPRQHHELGGDQVEGRQAVLELLRAGARPVRELWLAEGLEPSPQIDEIERLAGRRKVRTRLVPRRRVDAAARTDAPQGVLARARALEEADLEALCRLSNRRTPFLLVLDGVTDPHNLGSLLRTAECAGVSGVVVARHRAAHVTPTVAKVAAGAIEHVPIAVVPGIPAALARLVELGVVTVGLVVGASMSIYELGPEVDGPVALVLGAEGRGLAALSRKRCAALCGIPRHGQLESLNVGTAGAVACFELARRRHGGSAPG